MLRNLNLGPRLALAFGVLAIIVLLQGVFSLNKMQAVEAGGHEIMENWLPSIEALDNFKVALMRYRIFAVRMLLDVEPQNMSRNQAKRATLKNEIDKTQADYEKLISEDQEHKVFDELVKTKDQYFANVERIEALIKAGDIEKAGVVLDNDQLTLAENMVRQLQILSEINKSGSEKTIKSAAETFDSSRITVTASIVVSLIITIIMAYSITSSITVPIKKAVLATEVIARGDLSHRIEVIGRDEPALLLAGVAQMQANLRNTIQEIAHSSIQLAAATEELSAVAADNTRNMQRQSDEIQQAATAVTEMSSAVDEVARNAISASEASNQSSELAKDGLERVRQTVSSIENMTVEVTKTSSLMEGLAEQSQGIGKVLDVIRAIAEQTNLLALNAAIEAARAGEAGRGFAVVADEVRALAHRTQVSTQEIESMISKVQSGTYAAVTSMRDSSEHAKGTLGIAQQAGKALDEIFARSNTISDRNLMIATATEEQAAVAREVDRNIVNISDLSAQSAAGANQTSSSAHELARLATSLNNLVTKFVV